MAPSKTPGLTFQPCPISTCISPPFTYSLEPAMLSMSLLMSMPSHMKSFSVKVSPEIPEPAPISRMYDPGSMFRSSMALSAICL
jgi:hypothetical protein